MLYLILKIKTVNYVTLGMLNIQRVPCLWASSPSLAPLCRPAASTNSLPEHKPCLSSLISPRALGWLPEGLPEGVLREPQSVTSSKNLESKVTLYWPGWVRWRLQKPRCLCQFQPRPNATYTFYWLLGVISICHEKTGSRDCGGH